MEGVLLLEVDEGHVELVDSNQFISEHALVHNFDCDGILLNYRSMLNSREIS